MELGELLRASGVAAELRGDGAVEIGDLAYDSRRVGAGALFFCFAGERTDGHDFAPAAVEAGAAALVVERPLDLEVPQAQVEDARAAMAPIAAAFNGDPTSELGVVGITGTNGKTTTAFLVRHLLESAGRHCGLLGTVQQVVGGQVEEVERTTPEAIDLQRTFDRMLESGDEYCAMEVSSHALVLHRADAIDFAAKVFTNLSQDHLDFHADMEDYFEAKRLLFSGEVGTPILELEGGISVINLDDAYGRRLAGDLNCGAGGDCVSYSASRGEADLSARDVAFDASGSRFSCVTPEGEIEVRIPLPGDFNVANALAALGVAHALGLDLAQAAAALASAEQVPGRFESIDDGIDESAPAEVLVEQDRRAAIGIALGRAGDGDTVVIAGKGHEQGQEFENGRKIPFDDRDVAREELRKLTKAAAG